MEAFSSAPALPRKLVVAGLVVDDESGRVLITRRRPDQALGGYWEFPGGKIEAGESPPVALARELREELGAAVLVGPVWDVLHHLYPTFELLMIVYRCRLVDGEVARAVEVADLRWVPPGELGGHDILPADRPLVERLQSEPTPPWPPGKSPSVR